MKNGASVLDKQRQLQELEMKRSDLKRTFEADSMQEVYKAQAKLQECQGNLQITQSKMQSLDNTREFKQNEADRLFKDIQHKKNEREALINQWHNRNNCQFEYVEDCICPSCNQSLPEAQVANARNHALEQFNEKKN